MKDGNIAKSPAMHWSPGHNNLLMYTLMVILESWCGVVWTTSWIIDAYSGAGWYIRGEDIASWRRVINELAINDIYKYGATVAPMNEIPRVTWHAWKCVAFRTQCMSSYFITCNTRWPRKAGLYTSQHGDAKMSSSIGLLLNVALP